MQRCTLGGSAEFTIQAWHSAEISERRVKMQCFFFVDDEPRRWTNLAICAEREEHDAPPVFFVWSFSSAVENQVSARALRLRFRRSCQCPCAAA